jgi:hypothetical protein
MCSRPDPEPGRGEQVRPRPRRTDDRRRRGGDEPDDREPGLIDTAARGSAWRRASAGVGDESNREKRRCARDRHDRARPTTSMRNEGPQGEWGVADEESGGMDAALVTANFEIDDIKPLPRESDLDAFYYTDDGTLSRGDPAAVASWTRVIVPDYPRRDFGARLRARYFKHQIHRLPDVRPHRWLAWADGSLRFKDTAFLRRETERLRELPPRKRLLLVPHPERRTVREEYDYICAEIERGNEYHRIRYANEHMTEQMNFFAGQGRNLDARLWCAGFWMVESNAIINQCWDSWWDQTLRFGMMDQLSLPVLLDEFGLEPQVLDVRLWNNEFFEWIQHRVPM